MAESREEIYNVLQPFAERTKLQPSQELDEQFGAKIFFKPENHQSSRAFKQRGAGYKMHKLSEQGTQKVVTFSAGNHAQGVAHAAEILEMNALIVVPETAPEPKIQALEVARERMRRIGRGMLELVLYGHNFPEAAEYGLELAADGEREAVHPFDDRDVITGQGSIGHELLDDAPDLDAVLVQVGGGGLIAGVSEAIKSRNPHTKVIAVEPEGTPTFYNAREAGEAVDLESVDTFADGLAVRRVGDAPFDIAQEHVDETILVSNEEIKEGMRIAHRFLGERLEPAGAVGLAGLAKAIAHYDLQKKQIAVINTGGNVADDVFEQVTQE